MSVKEKASLLTIFVALVFTILKFVVFFISGSIAVLSEAWHSFGDIFTSLMVFLSLRKDRLNGLREQAHEEKSGAVGRLAAIRQMPVETKVEGTVLDEIPRIIEKFRHKANGIFNGDFFQHLDKSNSNKFYNFFVTKKGDQYGYKNKSGALKPDDFEKVLKFTDGKIVQLAEEIVSGKIDVWPYRIGTESPCSYCKYKSVCRFDWQINDYNFLESLNKLQVLEKIGTVDG